MVPALVGHDRPFRGTAFIEPNHRAYGMFEMRTHHRRMCGWCSDTSIAKDDNGELRYSEPSDRPTAS